jgi:hypothetical protein
MRRELSRAGGNVRTTYQVAVRGRADAACRALPAGERALTRSGVQLPPGYDASVLVLQMFSPADARIFRKERGHAAHA